jgi:starch phosphorylase
MIFCDCHVALALFADGVSIALGHFAVNGLFDFFSTDGRLLGCLRLATGRISHSELDGWWAETYTLDVGWAIGDGQEHGDDPAWDARTLYGLLEQKVIPEFYSWDKSGIPVAWIQRIRESMARLRPRFSADRAVRQYTEQRYLPAAVGYRLREKNKGEMGKSIVDWRRRLNQNWGKLRFGQIKIETGKDRHQFEVQLYSEVVDPTSISVELYANGVKGGAPERQEMKRIRQLSAAPARECVHRGSFRLASARRLYRSRNSCVVRCRCFLGID